MWVKIIKAIEELNRYKARLNTVVKELETLEDGRDANYQDVIVDLRWVVHILEQRREQLQREGRHI